MAFNPPPNWPPPPPGWTPPEGWQPDPSWGPAPEGWQFWTPDDTGAAGVAPGDVPGRPSAATPGPPAAKKKHTLRNALIGAGAAVVLLIIIIAIASGGGGGGDDDVIAAPAATPTVEEAAGEESPEPAQTTERPEPTPTPTPTPEGPAQGAAFWGDGADVVTLPPLGDTVWTAKISYSGDRYFSVWSVDGQGQELDLLANEIGAFTAVVPLNFSDDPAALKVDGAGAWTIELVDLRAAPRWDGSGTYTGSGSNVVIVQDVAQGLTPVTITHDGEHYFSVWAWGENGRDLLANEVGAYSGTTLLPTGTVVLVVNADGSWTIARA